MSYIGVTQSSDIDMTLNIVKRSLLEGHPVQIEIRSFGKGSREHEPLEYEVYVDYDTTITAGSVDGRSSGL